jgi:hypothetical protein
VLHTEQQVPFINKKKIAKGLNSMILIFLLFIAVSHSDTLTVLQPDTALRITDRLCDYEMPEECLFLVHNDTRKTCEVRIGSESALYLRIYNLDPADCWLGITFFWQALTDSGVVLSIGKWSHRYNFRARPDFVMLRRSSGGWVRSAAYLLQGIRIDHPNIVGEVTLLLG